MGDPRRVRPDELEILVARELRKAGVMLSSLVMTRNVESSKDAGEYSIDFGAISSVFHDKLLISLMKALRYVCSSSLDTPALWRCVNVK